MFQYLQDFYNLIISGLYDLMVWFIAQIAILAISFAIFTLHLSWDAAKLIIEQLGIGQYMQQLFSQIDVKTMSVIQYLKIPDAINLVMTSYVTRYVMSFF